VRIFKQGYKINFADTNDVLVGFDDEGSCCESFGYFFTDKVGDDDPLNKRFTAYYSSQEYPSASPANLEELVFDPEFYRNEHGYDGGGYAIFRLISPLRELSDRRQRERERQRIQDEYVDEVYLVLYNHHNGYYSHGFEVTHSGKVIRSGAL